MAIASGALQDPVRIGVLFAPHGVFQTFETAFLQGVIAGIDAVNRAGGIGGRRIEPVYHDPQSDPARYPGLISRLVLDDGVSHVFGGVTSPCRKAALPMVERLGALLWYPNQYEGFETSPNVVYGGPCSNQFGIPLLSHIRACGRTRIALLGSDYCFPRECLRACRDLAEGQGFEIVQESYVPLLARRGDFAEAIATARAARAEVIVSAVVYPDLLKLFRAYRQSGANALDMPLANIAGSDMDLDIAGGDCIEGHIAVGPYFASMDSPENRVFVRDLRRSFGPLAQANMHTLASYNQIRLFARAVERAGTQDPDAIRETLPQVRLASAQGELCLDGATQGLSYRPVIGVARSKGGYRIVGRSTIPIAPDPYIAAFA